MGALFITGRIDIFITLGDRRMGDKFLPTGRVRVETV